MGHTTGTPKSIVNGEMLFGLFCAAEESCADVEGTTTRQGRCQDVTTTVDHDSS